MVCISTEAGRPNSLQNFLLFFSESENAVESSGNEQVAEDITEFMTINDIDLTLNGDNPKIPFLC